MICYEKERVLAPICLSTKPTRITNWGQKQKFLNMGPGNGASLSGTESSVVATLSSVDM